MFETIRIFPYNDTALHPLVNRSIAVALLTTLFSSPVPAVWAAPLEHPGSAKAVSASPNVPQKSQDLASSFPAPFEYSDMAKALSAPPNVPQEVQDLTSSFLDHTLPKLLTDDERLAYQLGLGDSMSNPVTVDRVLPLMLIRRDDVIELGKGKLIPLDLVNNTNNWIKDKAGRLVPNRIIFLLKANNSTSEAGPYSWSSITLEQSLEGSWRILQVGAPKLSRAMSQHGKQETNYFLLWLPDLNRHYLGRISAAGDARNPKILLTALFNDRLIRVKDVDGYRPRKAGVEFEASSQDFFKHLRDLYEDLDLPMKLRRKSDQGEQQAQTP